MANKDGWIGVDLDGTLAKYDEWQGAQHIGEPVPKILSMVKRWLVEGRTVKIFTARVSDGDPKTVEAIEQWCLKHLGRKLEVTNIKDYDMILLFDDRAIQVEQNTGRLIVDKTTLQKAQERIQNHD